MRFKDEPDSKMPANLNKPKCSECGAEFIPNIMVANGRYLCALCIRVQSQITDDWDKDFLRKMNDLDPLDGPRYG